MGYHRSIILVALRHLFGVYYGAAFQSVLVHPRDGLKSHVVFF